MPKIRRRATWAASLPILTIVAACAGPAHEPKPLEPSAVLAEVRTEREAFERPLETLTESMAAALLTERSTALRDANAAWQVALARVDEPTRRSNPTLGIGAVLGLGPDVVNRVVPYAALSWGAPPPGLLRRTDELAVAAAERARVELLALERELRLELRALIAELVARERALAENDRLVRSLEAAAEGSRGLVEAGAIGALEVSSLELELARAEASRLERLARTLEPRSALAELLAIPLGRLESLTLELDRPRPDRSPRLEGLIDRVDGEHPELLRRRFEYEIAERSLALELARAGTGWQASGSGSPDLVDDNIGLQLVPGLTLPLFDRNQGAVLEAQRRREAAAETFRSSSARIFADVEAAHRRLEVAIARRDMTLRRLVPAARSREELTRRTVEAGESGAIDLALARSDRIESELAFAEAVLAEQLAWSALERAIGTPLGPTSEPDPTTRPDTDRPDPGPPTSEGERP